MTDTYKQRCDEIVRALVGDKLVEQWWQSANRAFDGRTPQEAFDENPAAVGQYLLNQCDGSYS